VWGEEKLATGALGRLKGGMRITARKVTRNYVEEGSECASRELGKKKGGLVGSTQVESYKGRLFDVLSRGRRKKSGKSPLVAGSLKKRESE